MNHSPDDYNERVLMSIFACFGKPRSLLDLGCGNGAMVKLARRMGIDAVGVDISLPPDPSGEWGFIQHDLRTPFNSGQKFDMTICLEVAEHIDPVYADGLCWNIAANTAMDGRLIFSAALPGQDGEGHVNLQPPVYWRDKLWKQGKFSYSWELTAKLSLILSYTAGPMANWIPANLQVF